MAGRSHYGKSAQASINEWDYTAESLETREQQERRRCATRLRAMRLTA